MLKKICRVCSTPTTKKHSTSGVAIFCPSCETEVAYDSVEMDPLCPDCGKVVEFSGKCGQGFFCPECTALVSGRKIVWRRV